MEFVYKTFYGQFSSNKYIKMLENCPKTSLVDKIYWVAAAAAAFEFSWRGQKNLKNGHFSICPKKFN